MSIMTSELYELKLRPKAAPGAVVESTKLWAREVVLHITRVPVVGDVEDRQPHSSLVLLLAEGNLQPLGHKQIKCRQLRKASTTISWTNVVLLLIQDRIRKATAPVQNRRGDNVLWQSDVTPEK